MLPTPSTWKPTTERLFLGGPNPSSHRSSSHEHKHHLHPKTQPPSYHLPTRCDVRAQTSHRSCRNIISCACDTISIQEHHHHHTISFRHYLPARYGVRARLLHVRTHQPFQLIQTVLCNLSCFNLPAPRMRGACKVKWLKFQITI